MLKKDKISFLKLRSFSNRRKKDWKAKSKSLISPNNSYRSLKSRLRTFNPISTKLVSQPTNRPLKSKKRSRTSEITSKSFKMKDLSLKKKSRFLSSRKQNKLNYSSKSLKSKLKSNSKHLRRQRNSKNNCWRRIRLFKIKNWQFKRLFKVKSKLYRRQKLNQKELMTSKKCN